MSQMSSYMVGVQNIEGIGCLQLTSPREEAFFTNKSVRENSRGRSLPSQNVTPSPTFTRHV
jgi:hypothetical protein